MASLFLTVRLQTVNHQSYLVSFIVFFCDDILHSIGKTVIFDTGIQCFFSSYVYTVVFMLI